MTEQDKPRTASEAQLTDMTKSAIKEQTISAFNSLGWTKVVAPAKVNLVLGIGARREDGYHKATSLLHALNIHDVVYLRKAYAGPGAGLSIRLSCTGVGDIEVPDIAPEDNIAYKAVALLAEQLGRAEDETIEIHIEKNIPFQAGLGGGSADAAAALVGAARLWGIAPDDPVLEAVAPKLGADVAFFLRGGCGLYRGAGDVFERALAPMKQAVALVKPACGVSTAAAYAAFDADPCAIDDAVLTAADQAQSAEEVMLFNNLAPAAESLAPELAEVKSWLDAQAGVRQALLCGSGATTFAVCESFEAALAVVAEARRRGWWARATSFGSLRASVVPQR